MTDRRKFDKRADLTRVGWFNASDDRAPPNGVHPDLGLIVQSHGRFWQVITPVCPECSSEEVRYDERDEKICFDCGWASGQFNVVNDKISAGRIDNNDGN